MSTLIFILALIISIFIPNITETKREIRFYALGALVGMTLMIRWM